MNFPEILCSFLSRCTETTYPRDNYPRSPLHVQNGFNNLSMQHGRHVYKTEPTKLHFHLIKGIYIVFSLIPVVFNYVSLLNDIKGSDQTIIEI